MRFVDKEETFSQEAVLFVMTLNPQIHIQRLSEV